MPFQRVTGLVCWALLGAAPAMALDREAFIFTRYQLTVEVNPPQGRLAGHGTITLRNDSTAPQRRAVMQISSTLSWTSIRAGERAVAFVAQPFVSDVDHTGSVTEAIVTLPEEVPPGGSVELAVSYEGEVPADATRLTRIGTPEEMARRSEWDRVSPEFTAVRGAGYVAWYPMAAGSANLSDGEGLFLVLARWKERQARSSMRVRFQVEAPPLETGMVLANGEVVPGAASGTGGTWTTEYVWEPLGHVTPTFAAANFRALLHGGARVYHLPGRESVAAQYAEAATALESLVAEWFGPPKRRFELVEMAAMPAVSSSRPEAVTRALEVAPYESGPMLFAPLRPLDRESMELGLVHHLTHASLRSPRFWVEEGAAHFAQALLREQQGGRSAALEYMGGQLPLLAATEKALAEDADDGEEAASMPSLVTATDEVFYRTKAMYVWWMLRDLVGEAALKRALRAYRAEEDDSPAYVQRLVEKESGKKLEWFFDDWVYRGRGLPDFRIAAAYPRPTLAGAYTVTVTVENLGGAGAEVPVTVRATGGYVTERVLVPANSKAVVRLQVPTRPLEATVNDASVPESDASNNSAPISAEAR